MATPKDITKFVSDEISKEWELDTVDIPSWAISSINVDNLIDNSLTRIRFDLFKKGILSITPKKTQYICSVFKAERGKQSVNYAYLYSYIEGNKVIHDYVCFSPTFMSCDGEYRYRFKKFSNLKTLVEKIPFLDQLETMVHKDISSSLNLYAEHFIDLKNKRSATLIRKSIMDSRIAIQLYIASWVTELIFHQTGMFINHVMKNYHTIMFDDILTKQLTNKLSIDHKQQFAHIDDMLGRVQFIDDPISFDHPSKRHQFMLGQKTIPLTVQEVANYEDIKYRVWRELYIIQLANDLVLNSIATGTPFFMNWFFIQNSRSELFDSPSMQAKINNGVIAQNVIYDLEKARNNAYKKKGEFINYSFEQFSDKIEYSMDFAEDTLVMSDISIVYIIEHVGRTLSDTPALVEKNMGGYVDMFAGDIYGNIDVFSKYAFEVLYNLYCFNSKLGVIHGDLHLNNITLFGKMSIKTNMHNIYVTDDHSYIFPQKGANIALIDFSRGLLSRDRLLEDFDEIQANLYLEQQRKQMLRLYEHNFPEFYTKYSNKLKAILYEQFDDAFKIFTAFDTYYVFLRWKSMLEDLTKIKVNSDIIKLIESIIAQSWGFLTKTMIDLLNKKTTITKYPNLAIIEKLFDRFEITNVKDHSNINVVDIYNSTKDLKYKSQEVQVNGDITNMPDLINWTLESKFKVSNNKKKFLKDNKDAQKDNKSVGKLSDKVTNDILKARVTKSKLKM